MILTRSEEEILGEVCCLTVLKMNMVENVRFIILTTLNKLDEQIMSCERCMG